MYETVLVCMIFYSFIHIQRTHIFLGTHIYLCPELFSIAFLSGLQIKSNRYIAELCDIIFSAYSRMYWIMLCFCTAAAILFTLSENDCGGCKLTWLSALLVKSRALFKLRRETEQVFITKINLVKSTAQWVLNRYSHNIVDLII